MLLQRVWSEWMSDLISFGVLVLQGIVIFFLVGMVSIKVFIWGAFGTGLLSLTYMTLPGLDANAMLGEMIPRLLGVWGFYPLLIGELAGQTGSFGEIAIVGVFALVNVVPYLLGILVGLVAWPELAILRIIF